jgi:signal transduction histidine kinase/ligand-binding sensor domain-containing protein
LKKLYVHIILLIALLAISLQSFAQISSTQNIATLPYFSTPLSQDQGLSQGSNYFRYEDSKGFMWLTCNDAINRYDGAMVKVYNLNKYFMDCPNLQQGYGFAEDAQSNIYIGSVNGLYIYHRKQDKFTLQKIFTDNTDAVAMPFAFYKGKVWCFNKEFQVATYDVLSKKIEVVIQLPLAHLLSVNVYQLPRNMFYFHWPMIDKQGILYASSSNNIASYHIDTKQMNEPCKELLAQHQLSIYATCYDSTTNTIYFGTDKGIIVYDALRKTQKYITNFGNLKLELIPSVAVSKKYIAIRNASAVILLNKKLTQYQKLKSKYLINEHLAIQFDFDKNERLWLCNNAKGQVIYDFASKLLHKGSPDEALFANFKEMGITRFAEMPDGNICMPAVINNGRLSNIILNTTTNEKKLVDIKFSSVHLNLQLATDKTRKGIWFFTQEMKAGSTQIEISFFDEHFKIKPILNSKNGFQQGLLQNVKVIDNNKILCAFEFGLYYFNIQTKTFDSVTGGMTKNAFVINPISNHKLATSYINGDMIIYKMLPNGNLQKEKNVLHGIQSFYLAEDSSRQNYWVGTNQGVYVLDKNFAVLKKIDANNGLAGTYIYGLLIGDDGNIYCSHQRGLSSINGITHQVINFDKSDGIQDWDFHNRGYYKASNGTLCFGGASGFNYFKPPLFHVSNYQPQIYIDDILINNESYQDSLSADNIYRLQLNYKRNNISIKTIVKDLANAQSLQIAYRFKNKESTWHYLPNNSNIVFNSLAPDDYNLQIGYFDKFTNKVMIQKEIAIVIASPFYQKNWFWVLCAIGATTLFFYLFYKRKARKQKVIVDQQNALSQQRQKITADLHDDVGATLSSLQLNSTIAKKMFQKNPTRTNEILDIIETQSKELSEKIGDIIWSMKSEDDAFGTFSDRIKTYANQILDYSTIEYTMHINAEVDTYITSSVMKKNLILASKEAINNAVKYSQAKHISIDCKIINKQIVLQITDDGIGFAHNNKGNGLKNMKTRIEELQGIFTIESEINKGTSIIISVPI